jgi:hypothetical protein
MKVVIASIILLAALPALGQQSVHLQDVIPPTDTPRPAVEHIYTCPAGYSLAHWEPGNMDYGINFGDNIGGMFVSPETYGHYEKVGVAEERDILRGGAPVCLKDEPPVSSLKQSDSIVGINTLTFSSGVISVSKNPQTFHNCSLIGQSGNSPHLFDVSEIYQCEEGQVEIVGKWGLSIENGYVYKRELGRPVLEATRLVSASDYKDYKWCPTPTPWDANQKEMCGDRPTTCFDGKPATWDSDWQGYSCTTRDHNGKPAAPPKKENSK